MKEPLVSQEHLRALARAILAVEGIVEDKNVAYPINTEDGRLLSKIYRVLQGYGDATSLAEATK